MVDAALKKLNGNAWVVKVFGYIVGAVILAVSAMAYMNATQRSLEREIKADCASKDSVQAMSESIQDCKTAQRETRREIAAFRAEFHREMIALLRTLDEQKD